MTIREPLIHEEELAKQIALDLASIDSEGSKANARAMRVLRAGLIYRLYSGGRNLKEIGDLLGLSRERVRQVLNAVEGKPADQRPRRRSQWSEEARSDVRSRAKARRMSGEAQLNPKRNAEIERLVALGLSYAEVARAIGISRNIVCTVMYRAKHRTDDLIDGKRFPPLPKWKGRTTIGSTSATTAT